MIVFKDKLAFSATLHCLTGCAIGEITGLIIGAALGLGTVTTIVLAVTLAFLFGYTLSLLPLIKGGRYSAFYCLCG
jgi:TctA family transporter